MSLGLRIPNGRPCTCFALNVVMIYDLWIELGLNLETYITTPLIETTAAVCELNVLLPDVAKSAHDDHGPLRLVAVQ